MGCWVGMIWAFLSGVAGTHDSLLGPGFDPWSGTKDPASLVMWPKKKLRYVE